MMIKQNRVGLLRLMLVCGLLFGLTMLVGALGAQWQANAGDIVYSTALSADGAVQVVGARNDRAVAYDAAGSLLWEFNPDGTIWGVAVSDDGQWTALASEDRNVYMIDNSGEQIWSYRSSRIVLDVAISRDGSRVLAVDEGREMVFLNGETGAVEWSVNLPNVSDAITMYGGDTIRPIASTRGGQILLYSPNGQRLWMGQLGFDVTSIDVNRNGRYIVVGTLDGQITLLNGANSDVIWQTTLPDDFRCTARDRTACIQVAVDGDGENVLVGAKNGGVYLLSGEDGTVLQRHNAGAPVSAVALEADTWLIGTETGDIHATTTQAAFDAYTTAQTARRNLMIAVPIVLLILAALLAVWVRTTDSGRRFWQPVGKTIVAVYRSRISYLMLLPTVILLLIFNYYPAASGLYHSFTEWTPGVETTWVGLDQFRAMFDSQYFWVGMKNALILAVSGFLKLAMPLLVAELIFHIRGGRLQYALRTLFIIPLVLPSVVGILLWVNIYDPNIGLLNETLQAIGLDELTRSWLGNRDTAMTAIVAIGAPWVNPFALLIFYGGLIAIPSELFDAAKVDGANWWQRFSKIDIPMLMSQIKLLLILAFITSFQEFQLIFLTTGGGPGSSTYTPALELYYNATRFNNFGLASAMGTFLFLIILAGTIFNLRYVRSQTEYEA